ncbi:hypothetical protein [Nocardioides fonticola]|uniref:hypothetical protein n=1 Tax=Nocardioides fonticola TaxID=450363 RepID=UPI0031D845DF
MKTWGIAQTMWFTIAVHLLALGIAVVMVFAVHLPRLGWLPVVSLAVGGVVGSAALAGSDVRRFGVGCLLGTTVSVVVFAALLVLFFVQYFVIGGHELS